MALWDIGSGHVNLPNFGATPNELVYGGQYLYVGDAVQSLIDQGAFDWIQQQNPEGTWLQWMIGLSGNTMFYLNPGWPVRVWLYKAAVWYYWPYGSGVNPPDGGDGDGNGGGTSPEGGGSIWLPLAIIGGVIAFAALSNKGKTKTKTR